MKPPTSPFTIGAVLFPDFELLDVYGPLEMFGMLQDRVSITMVAEQAGAVASRQGPKGVADLSFHESPGFDLILVPGGLGTRREIENPVLLDALRKFASQARFIASVCTGSALLARAGILDGKRATSNKLAFDWVVAQGPNVTWAREARWVEDGSIFTSSGVSAGMDMALALIRHIFGDEMSASTAQRAEYVWNQDKTLDPFASVKI